MYFEDRAEAGQKIAAELIERYRYENCAVVALSDGGVVVGEQIAASLHCILTLLLIENIEVPGENLSFGSVSEGGLFSFNTEVSKVEMAEYVTEYHSYLDEQKREAFQRINRLLGEGGFIDHDMLRDHTIILVNDGFDKTVIIDAALEFLKPIRFPRLVIVSPVVSTEAIDKLHVAADELHILDVKSNYFGTNHYYNNNDIPTHQETVEKINKIILNWR